MVESAAQPAFLVVTELFRPTNGGTAVWFDEVYRRLGDRTTHVVTARVEGSDAIDADHPNTIHRLDLRRHPWLRPESLAMYAKLTFAALGLTRHHRFDAVHAGRILPEGFAAWVAARISRRPFVVYAHGEEITTWTQPGKFQAMGFLFRRADAVVVNSHFTAGEVARLGVMAERIVRIAPGVDVSRFRPGLDGGRIRARLGIGRGTRLLLSVGRLSRRKGFDHTIEAVARLRREGVALVYAIVGTGEDRRRLAAEIERHGVGDSVFLEGPVSDAELPFWYAAADIFVMANREIDGDTEGFGIVYMEAAACGTPAIAGRAGGTGSAVVDGETGVLVDGADVNAIEEVIRRLVEDDAYRARLAKAACVRARRDFSWERVAADTLALCHALEAGGPLSSSVIASGGEQG